MASSSISEKFERGEPINHKAAASLSPSSLLLSLAEVEVDVATAADYANVLKERLRLSARQEFALQLISERPASAAAAAAFTCSAVADSDSVGKQSRRRHAIPEARNQLRIYWPQSMRRDKAAQGQVRLRLRVRFWLRVSFSASFFGCGFLMIAHSERSTASQPQ